jgi:predicted DNA-binding transcriptional regulator AlpA
MMVQTRSKAKTVDVPTAADMLGISSRQAYALIRRDEFPVPTLRLGRRVVVPTRPLLDALGEAR